jgi:4-hydroxybutyryl-CoA dehydratase/vinylacetyl-CoA-Delta-isomerase
MMTGLQYKKSLDDNRETYFEGERVRDIVTHPLLGECVSRIAAGYDQFYSPEPGAVSPLMKIPRSANELRDRIPLLLESDIVANVTSNRS